MVVRDKVVLWVEVYRDPVNGQLLFAKKDDPARKDPTTGAIFPAGCEKLGEKEVMIDWHGIPDNVDFVETPFGDARRVSQ